MLSFATATTSLQFRLFFSHNQQLLLILPPLRFFPWVSNIINNPRFFSHHQTATLPINDEKLEKLLSLMQSNDDDHVVEPSSLDHMNLTIHQDFIIKVLEKTELHIYYHVDLVNFFKWVWSQHSLHLTTLVLQSLVFKICGNFRLYLRDKDTYILSLGFGQVNCRETKWSSQCNHSQ